MNKNNNQQTSQSKQKKYSKFLSLILRHNPQIINLSLDHEGWADVTELLKLINTHGEPMTMQMLEKIVSDDNKQRFCFNNDKTKIRANQGHSLKVDLGYSTKTPPKQLYHGTASRFVDLIYAAGAIQKMSRHHVHLSADKDTAANVGQRHGKLVIFAIDTQAMVSAGFDFYLSDNGVWLVDEVPVEFITKITP